jgi:hypothetical protein
MSSYRFGKRSAANLATCDARLRELAELVLSYGVADFSIIEGHRSIERQQELFNADPPKTHIDGITRKSKHNHSPSLALDFLPYPAEINGVNVWQDTRRFTFIAGMFFAAAAELGVKIRWGGDWDGDGNNADSKLDDLPHIEIDE